MTSITIPRLASIAVAFLISPGLVPAQTAAIPFFDDSTVQVINLTMAPADWVTLQQNYLLDTYYPATFAWNGMTVSNVGVRSHGSASRSPIKPNLDINFAHYETQSFLGLPFVLLKANNEDPSNLAEWISMKLYRKMGIPAPREAPAQVFLNGQILGFYYIVEHEDVTFLERNFGEDGGYLYEWKYTHTPYNFNNLGTDPSLYAPFLDLKTAQPAPDLQTFANLVQVINQPSSASFTNADFISALSQYMDPKQFLLYGAIDQALTAQDGLIGGEVGMNNFYLYQFQGTTLYYFIPWDKGLVFSQATLDILSGITMPGLDSNGPDINLLAQRLYSIPEYQQFYLEAIVNASSLMGGTGGWADSEITREYNVIYNAATDDPNKQCLGAGVLVPCGNAEFQASVNYIHSILATRQAFVDSEATADGYIPSTGGPQILAGGVAALGNGPQVSPSAISIVAGTGFGPAAQAAGAPLPRILGNTFVAVDGVRAPLFSTASGSIEFQIPGDIPPQGDVNVVVSTGGDTTGTEVVTMQGATPYILAVIHQNGTAVVAGNPVVAGETLSIYATGLGAVNPDVPIGSPPPAGAPTTTVLTVQASLGNASAGNAAANVAFSGLVPGYVGLYQMDVQMPQVLPSGASAQLNVTIGGQSVAAPLALQ